MIRPVFAAILFSPIIGLLAAEPARKLETLLLLPEPGELRSALSITPEGAVKSVLSPACETAERPGIAAYEKQDFSLLGISVDTFRARAKAAADRVLASLEPEIIKDAAGRVLYAVYRSDRPIIACLLVAPSLPKRFEKLFGAEIWVAVPDRHSLFVFPPKPDVLADYSDDLADRFSSDPYAASPEVFSVKLHADLKVVGSFGNR